MELPTTKTKPTEVNPLFSVFFGKPKSGKSTIAAALPDALLIDLEQGSHYLEALSVQVKNFEDLVDLKKSLHTEWEKKERKPVYTFGVFDTATALEELVLPFAKKMYKETPMGKNFDGEDVRKLPNGAGY